jgi:hypothetical protein
LYGQLNVATGNLTSSPAIPAEVVETGTVDVGNFAVVKLAQGDLPAVELNTSSTLQPGISLLAIGYGTTTNPPTNSYTVQTKPAQVVGLLIQTVATAYRISDDLGAHSFGGMAIDTNGRVVGMLDRDQTSSSGANNAVVPMSAATAPLSQAGVTNTLSETDKLYRSGLDAYFAGKYSTAISQLDTVAKNSPANLTAQAYQQNAIARRTIEGESSRLPVWAISLLAGLGGAIVLGLVALVVTLLRRRRRSQPAEGARIRS